MTGSDRPLPKLGCGWRFIDLAGLGINTGRSHVAALLWIVLCPLAAAVVLGAAAGISGVIKQRPPGVLAPSTAILEQYGPIVVAGAALLYGVARIHRRPWQSLIAPNLRLDSRRLAIGFAVEAAILGGQLALVLALTGWPLMFKMPEPLGVFVLALLLIPLQAASEELLFRGYLTQTLGRIVRSRLVIALVVGLVFGGLHLNVYGPLTVAYFLVLSLIFSLVSLRDERLELVIGGHAAMNLFAFLVASAMLGPESPAQGMIGAGGAALPFNAAAIGVLAVNGALFYGLTRLLLWLIAGQGYSPVLVALRNKTTGELKLHKIGWSWTCFLFSGILGIPLFIRRLNIWGSLMVLLWVINFVIPLITASLIEQTVSMIGIFLIQVGFSIAFGITANSMAGKNYLEHGWEFAEPASASASAARERWGLPALRSSTN